MKVLIIGRTGRGKDTLQEVLTRMYGWKFVLSTTTREKRFPEENTHVFVTKEEAAAIPIEDKVAVTFIKNGDTKDEYFATRKQVKEADAYLIDPIGMQMLLKNMPEETFAICYLISDETQAKEMAIARAADPKKAERIFKKRSVDEDAQFTKFEQNLWEGKLLAGNCILCRTYYNDYTVGGMERIAADLQKQGLLDR